MDTKVIKVLKKPSLLFLTLGHRGVFNWMSDEMYLRIAYRIKLGKRLNLEDPKSFNEKIQWLKLHDRNPIYTKMVDKIAAKKMIAEKIGNDYIIPTLGVWEKFDEIDFNSLPDQFVLKCSHDSGGLIICHDKSKLDKEKARRLINGCLKHSFYWGGREWPYKDVKPRIIAEALLQPDNQQELVEYKIFCSYGEPNITMVCKGKAHSTIRSNTVYDLNFNMIPVDTVYPRKKIADPVPSQYKEMLQLSHKLSEGFPFVRVDMYICKEHIYIGELTLYHNSGFCPFNPKYYDDEFGKIIDIQRFQMELSNTEVANKMN